ncbi:MAG TPA: RNA-directed DNA polymerase [Patescibacteria group bacterium]|nr:RNA-directed DNA polymerase [Patescibacteria group bacterium]
MKQSFKIKTRLLRRPDVIKSELLAMTKEKVGIPIGNVTSQIFANIYLNELDQFIKHQLKIKYYFRYADDFVILHPNQQYLENLVTVVSNFLEVDLNLRLHPNKIIIRKFRQGIDFLGYVVLPYYILLRTKTKRRMLKKIRENVKKMEAGLISQQSYNQSVQSYLGMLQHCLGYKIEQKICQIANLENIFKIS